MRTNTACWFEIYVQNLKKAKAFYEGLLGVSLSRLNSPDMEMWAFPAENESFGIGGALVHMPGFPARGNTTIIYFACEDCAVEAGSVSALGGRLEKPKFSIGEYGHIRLAYDPEGNMFGLHSLK